MPTLNNHHSNEFTKLLIMGDSGSGKTGALTSLLAAGYKLRILDYDNGLEVLKQFGSREADANLENVEYVTLRDDRKASPTGSIIKPTAFIKGIKLLDKWKYTADDGSETDLGDPAAWGPDCILVIDSLTFMSDAAFNFREPLVPRGSNGKYDLRAVYKDAQDAVEDMLALITSESFRTNVIVIAHINYLERPDGTKKGYPTAVGSALSPHIPTYFNSVALCETRGGARTIQTTATAMIDLKNPKPFEMLPKYDIGDGLAAFFAVLREPPAKVGQPKPKSIPLKRA